MKNYKEGEKMQFICCFGQRDNGKDVVSDYLGDKIESWKRSAFANPVKDIFCDAFGVDRKFIEQWKRNPEPPPGFQKSVRECLQYIGDGFRNMKEDVWHERGLRDKNLIISDGRYINEAMASNEKDGFNIVVYRPGYLNNDESRSESEIRSVVEWCLNNIQEGFIPEDDSQEFTKSFHYFLINDGSLEDLYKKIDEKLLPWLSQLI
jgi:hypothetical protein